MTSYDVTTDLNFLLTYLMTRPNRFQVQRALTEPPTSYSLVWTRCNVNFINTISIPIYIYDVIVTSKLTWLYFARIWWHAPIDSKSNAPSITFLPLTVWSGCNAICKCHKYHLYTYIYDVRVTLKLTWLYFSCILWHAPIDSKSNAPSIRFLPPMVWSGHDAT